jgi:hypothetical protein
MAIQNLTVCDWEGPAKRDIVIDSPTWSDVEGAIRALNNRNLNDIYLRPDNSNVETFLCVGGGDGQYIVSGSINSEFCPTLVDTERPAEPKAWLIVGGQAADYPNNWIVNLEAALKAAKAFYEDGGFTRRVKWTNV